MTDIAARVATIIADFTGEDLSRFADPRTVTLAKDLSLDSLDLVELSMEIEDVFSIEITDDETAALGMDGPAKSVTIGDVVALIERKRGEGAEA